MAVTRLSGGTTPANGSDPRTFPTIWNATADVIEANETAIDSLALTSLSGVSITSPVDNQLLTYNGTNWVNEAPASPDPITPGDLPAGSVLQVVSTSAATQTNTTSLSYENTAASVSITPTSTSSKILVFSFVGLYQTGGNTGANLTIARDTTPIGQYTSLFEGSSLIVSALLQTLDSPATTSSVTYRTRIKTENVSFTAAAARHEMIAMEVAG